MKQKLNKLDLLLISNMPFMFALFGVASIVYASFLFTQILGFTVLGIAFIVVAYLISPDKTKGR